jgi:hypothetical protein
MPAGASTALCAAPYCPISSFAGPCCGTCDGARYWLRGGACSNAAGKATHNWKPRPGVSPTGAPVCQTPAPACIHSTPPAGNTPAWPVVSS